MQDDHEHQLTVTDVSDAIVVSEEQPGTLVPGAPGSASDIYRGLAERRVTDQEAEVLIAPVDTNDLDILPTGEVYLSQVGYRNRLSKVFGPGGWAMRPIGKPIQQGKTLLQEWGLYARGHFLASAYGEADYHEDNERQSYATALESLKSNALMRCCKDLSIAAECWNRRFCQAFQAEYCIKVWRTKVRRKGGQEGEYQWRRKDAPPFYDEKGAPVSEVTPTQVEEARITEEQAIELNAMIVETGSDLDKFKAYFGIAGRAIDDLPASRFATAKKMLAGAAAKKGKGEGKDGSK